MTRNQITHIKDWKPARQFPETYPGDRPDHHYLILDDRVFALQFEDPQDFGSGFVEQADGRPKRVDSLLTGRGLPTLTERFASLAYGANRNPATLHIKFLNYEYRSPGQGLAVPVLRGRLRSADVVAGGLSGQGYMYGDLLIESEHTRHTVVEAWVALLDEDQLRVINDSEGVSAASGAYVLAQFPGYRIGGCDQEIAPIGYAGSFPIFMAPSFGTPISFASVEAANRSLPAMTPREMFDHLLDVFAIRQEVSKLTGLDNDESLAAELAKYMNGQWWYRFNTRDEPIPGYRQVVRLLDELIQANSENVSTAEIKRKQGLVLPREASYPPDKAMTLGGLLT